MAFEQFPETTLQYSDVPWYRRRCFVLLMILFFAPAAILVGTTGDIYAKVGGKVRVFPKANRRVLVLAACTFTVLGLTRALLG